MDHATYDEFNNYVNFTDPARVTEAIVKSKSSEFGYLNAPSDAKIFDIGMGTGLLGKLLKE